MMLQKGINFILYNQYLIFVEILLIVYIFVVKDINFCDCQISLINIYKIVDLFCEKGPGGLMS